MGQWSQKRFNTATDPKSYSKGLWSQHLPHWRLAKKLPWTLQPVTIWGWNWEGVEAGGAASQLPRPPCGASLPGSRVPSSVSRVPVRPRGAPPSTRGGARSPSGRALARSAVVLPASFPSSHRHQVGMATRQPVPEPPAFSAHAAATAGAGGQRLSHDASRQPSPQWAAMLSEWKVRGSESAGERRSGGWNPSSSYRSAREYPHPASPKRCSGPPASRFSLCIGVSERLGG